MNISESLAREDNNSRPNKRIKTNDDTDALLQQCLQLLFTSPIPSTLNNNTTKSMNADETISTFRELWKDHGFRTTMVTSPRPAVSIYLDSCYDTSSSTTTTTEIASNYKLGGREYLQLCIGMHPNQVSLESIYSSIIKNIYCLTLFLKRMRSVREGDMNNTSVLEIISPWEKRLEDILSSTKCTTTTDTIILQELSESSSRILSQLLSKLAEIDHSLRNDQLLHEYNRITYENCTLANSCLHRWIYGDDEQQYDLDEVYYKASPPGRYLPKYERITINMKDFNAVEPSKSKLILLPSLTKILTSRAIEAATNCTVRHPLDSVVDDMVLSTWDNLLRCGYYVDETRKRYLGPELKKFYLSGLQGGKDINAPILLNAHFTPTYPLSLYLYGTAGAGKSSLVSNLYPSINEAISIHCDPELCVRFCKQNLNKPFKTLQLELDLRPNNNDYSVMSIIQGRRMTLSQSKPGLVLVGLEEMPSNNTDADPNQSEVGKLISMRFSGRKGEFKGGQAPRNSAKRGEHIAHLFSLCFDFLFLTNSHMLMCPKSFHTGISGDATIITVFTSNYDLEAPCFEALQQLDMFKNLAVIKCAPVSGKDRNAFSLSYLTQRVKESLLPWNGNVDISLDIPCGEGDTRPLVRYLRMLSFHIHSLVVSSKSNSDSNAGISIAVSFDFSTDITQVSIDNGKQQLQLKSGSFHNLYAITPTSIDDRASTTVTELQQLHPNLKNPSELSQILDFYFAKTLCPAVIISHNKQLIEDLVKILSKAEGVHGISNIDPASYKMMKSLYDPNDTPNLRDDILSIVHADEQCSVGVELCCHTSDSQLQIREIIEDTPSMTAFSTERSALHKDGLLFGVYVDGEITPEIHSRASLLI